MEIDDFNSSGGKFQNAKEIWTEEIGEEDEKKKEAWYLKGITYWQGVEATLDGVLGGYANVNQLDIRDSEIFLGDLMKKRFGKEGRCENLSALDCGSGIGRITKHLLIRHFEHVDLVEPVSHFLLAASEDLKCGFKSSTTKNTYKFYCAPLQEFTPSMGRYDVIWIQWCTGHLTDDDFVNFCKKAMVGLKSNGFVVMKENISRTDFVLHKEDGSITRSDNYLKKLFTQSGLHVFKSAEQRGFPKELFKVKMYALTSDPGKKSSSKARAGSIANTPGIIK